MGLQPCLVFRCRFPAADGRHGIFIMACSRRVTWAASTLLTRETRDRSWSATAVVIEFIDLPSAGRLTGK